MEDLLVTAGEDDSIRTYNTTSGTSSKVLFSKKYGVAHICFTHDPQSVIYASTKVVKITCNTFLRWIALIRLASTLYIAVCLLSGVFLQGADHKIRYQTLHDNKYIRYFTGHTERVTGLCLSPKNDMFLSAAWVRASSSHVPPSKMPSSQVLQLGTPQLPL